MRSVLPFALILLLAACADAPNQNGGFSSHYFKPPPPMVTAIAPETARGTSSRAIENARTPDQLAAARAQVGSFSSHYHKRSMTEAAPAEPEKTAEAPKPVPAPPAPPTRAKEVATAEPDAETPTSTTGFSSHYRKQPPEPMAPEELAVKLETRVLNLVAEERHRIDPDAKALVFDQELTDVAREHSEDMAKNNYVAHANAQGETTATMIMDRDTKFRGILGENIASQSYNKDQDVDVDAFAQSLVDSWLNSADHKANLAYAPYERTGIGVAVNSHMIYVTQLFASDLGLPEPPDDPPPAATKIRKPAAPH